jgi:beta-phosphoglucomutase-like phosphatase (HAD superfamily)
VATDLRPVRAVLFDLDGTLIDSELHTDRAIAEVVRLHGISGFTLPTELTRGRTWHDIALSIRERIPKLGTRDLAVELNDHWNAMVVDVKPIPGAPEAIRAAKQRQLALAVVSSSPKKTIDSFLQKLGVADLIAPNARIGAEAVKKTKPDPEGYLIAASALKVEPNACLVFEDSQAGLLAARAAGMRSVFITCCAANVESNRALATAACTHYGCLPPRFWDELADGTADLSNRLFT